MKGHGTFRAVLVLGVGPWFLAGCAVEQPEIINREQLSKVHSLAVLPFEDAPGLQGNNSGTAVAGFITTELARDKSYRIVERSKLKTVLGEKDLQATDFVNSETAVRVGKMLGVEGVMVGSVSQYDMDKTTVYVHVVPVVSRDYKVGASIRIIDVSNGEIIYAHSASGKSANNFTEAGRQAARKLLGPICAGRAGS